MTSTMTFRFDVRTIGTLIAILIQLRNSALFQTHPNSDEVRLRTRQKIMKQICKYSFTYYK